MREVLEWVGDPAFRGDFLPFSKATFKQETPGLVASLYGIIISLSKLSVVSFVVMYQRTSDAGATSFVTALLH